MRLPLKNQRFLSEARLPNGETSHPLYFLIIDSCDRMDYSKEELKMETQQAVSSLKLQSPIALLENAVSLYKQRFTTFFVILLIPLLVSIASSLSPFLYKTSGIVPFTSVMFSIVSIFVTLLGGLALLYAIKDNAGIKASYRSGLKRVFSYFWLMTLSFFIIGGGFLFFVIPGIVFAVWFVFGGYIFVYENIGGMRALSKSKEYVKGRWLSVFLRLIVVLIFNVAIYIILTFLTGRLGFPTYAKTIASFTISAVIGPIFPIYLLLLYQNIRSVKGETI